MDQAADVTTKRDNTQRAGSALALLALALMVVLDLAIPPDYAILTSLFGLAPLIACAVVSPRGTAVIAALAIVAAILSGVWNDTLGTAQHNVRLLNVVLVGVAAVAIATVRVRRERRFAEVSQIAQAAQRAILPGPSLAGRPRRHRSPLPVRCQGVPCWAAISTTAITPKIASGSLSGTSGARGLPGWSRRLGSSVPSARPQRYAPPWSRSPARWTSTLLASSARRSSSRRCSSTSPTPGELRIVSAGHPVPQLVGRAGAVVLELPPGLPLGLGLGNQLSGYAEAIIPWHHGDRLLLYTDGLE